SLTLGDNFNNGVSLNIETKYDLTFSKNVQNLSNSNFYIGGHLIAPGQFDLENDSHVWVRGTKATSDTHTKSRIEKKLRIDATSSMCVNGDLAIEDFNNFYGKLFIKGIVTNLAGQKIEHANITYVTESNQDSYISKCGKTFDSPSSASIDWKDTSNTNINEVIY
ncbi:hypothetical protein, partial [Neobacillus niacini]|uniref:hypothetical protein n=1 Tax=Neobacillus niacini TaxID=86668 RepID=UPI002FFEAB4C